MPIEPGERSPGFVGAFSIDAGYFDAVGSTQLSWYNRQGNLLGQVRNTTTGIQRFVVALGDSDEEIYRWRIERVSTDANGFAIDNLCINTGRAFQKVDFSGGKRRFPKHKRPNVDVIPLTIQPSSAVPKSELLALSRNLKELKQGKQPKLLANSDVFISASCVIRFL
jgi:hypothetical protein